MCYKLGLVRTLIDRAFKINNTLLGFNEKVKKLSYILQKNQFPEGIINKVYNTYLDKVNKSTTLSVDSKPSDSNCILYFKLPYHTLSNFTKRKIHTLVKRYCKNLEINLVFSSFKIKNLMNVKDSVPKSLRSKVIYKFKCAECNFAYVGETSRHLSTRVREHLHSNKNSHIYKQLKGSEKCRKSCSDDCFKVLDVASGYNHLKINPLTLDVVPEQHKNHSTLCPHVCCLSENWSV